MKYVMRNTKITWSKARLDFLNQSICCQEKPLIILQDFQKCHGFLICELERVEYKPCEHLTAYVLNSKFVPLVYLSYPGSM